MTSQKIYGPVDQLSQIPLFFALSTDESAELSACFDAIEIRMGKALYTAGEEAPSLFIIVKGTARMVGLDADGREVTLGLWQPGQHLGEDALLSPVACSYTVRAAENLWAWRLTRDAFWRFLEGRRELKDLVDRYLRHASVRNFLRQLTSLKPLPAAAVGSLLRLLAPESFKQGDIIFRAGQADDKFYLVGKGRILVTRPEGSEHKTLDVVREGGYFGRSALVEAPHSSTAAALEETVLFSLSSESLDKALALSPELKEDLHRLLARFGPAEAEAARPVRGPAEPPFRPLPVRSSLTFRKRPGKFSWVRQHDETDCGAACLAMVSKHHGVETTLGRMRDLVNVTREGTTMLAIAEGAQRLGYATQGMLATRDYLRSFPLPAIAHWGGFHFVVVYQAEADKIHVADPALGLRSLTLEEFDKGWTGRILLLTPTERIFGEEPPQRPLARWLPLLGPYKALLAEVFLCSLVINLLGLSTPIFTQTLVDRVLVHHHVPMLNLLLAGMVLVAVFQILTSALRQYLLLHIGLRIDQALISRFFQHVLSLPIRFFERRRVGDVTSRIAENEKIRALMTRLLPSLALDVLMTVVYLAVMFFYNVRLTLAAVALLPLFALLTFLYASVMRRVSQEIFSKRTESESFGIESVAGIHTVKSMAIETPTLWKWNSLFGRTMRSSYRGGLVELTSESAGGLLSALSATVLLWYGAHQVIQGDLTVGQLMAFNMLVGAILAPVIRLIDSWGEAQAVFVAVDRLNDVFDSEPEESPRRHSLLPAPALKGRIQLEGVSFRYHPSDKKGVLKNVTLDIPAGATAALVGRSGAGKTTLAKLVLRLYLPTSGKVLIDGHDIAALSPAGLRRQMGVVPQETFLFSGTIRENIALGEPDAAFERVVEAASLAGAHDFVAEFPLGYDTPVGERGMSLSGGQRQRIAIARALLRDPRVLVFDEATSSLDSESEKAVQRNIAGILKGRTTLLIAHRLSTVKDADLIFVLDQGWLAESGSHRELMEKRGAYYHMVSRQLEA